MYITYINLHRKKSDKSNKKSWTSRRRSKKSSPTERSCRDKLKSSSETRVTSVRAPTKPEAEPILDGTEEAVESDPDNSQNSTNPFRKFMSGKNENILSEEIKRILANPITMPKLPSHFSRVSVTKKYEYNMHE